MLDEGSINENVLDAKTNRDPGGDDKAGVISYGFRCFEDGAARIPVLIDTNGTVVGLEMRSEKLTILESAGLGTLIAQE